jgi:hypothetical protein
VKGGRLRCFGSTELGWNAVTREIHHRSIAHLRMYDGDKKSYEPTAWPNECGNMYMNTRQYVAQYEDEVEVAIV